MNRSTQRPATRTLRARLKPLALALAFAGFGSEAFASTEHAAQNPTPQQPASTWTVTNCEDNGSGSLRDVIDHLAHDGDTVDMTALTCGTITLTTGAILATQNNLTIEGPGTVNLFIDAEYASRVLVHGGGGVLTVRNLSIWHGYGRSTGSSEAVGGGIASRATVNLDHVSVKYCKVATAGFGDARGAGVYAGTFAADHSMISGNHARTSDGRAMGAGVYATGSATFDYTTVNHNQSFANDASKSYAGGVVAKGGGVLRQSTISENEAGEAAGVVFVNGQSVIAQSTLSGNKALASVIGAGAHIASPLTVVVENSTITGNTERNPSNTRYGAGLHLGDNTHATIVSSIIAGNRLDDGTGLLWFSDVGGTAGSSVGGDHNLLTFSLLAAPADTLYSLDPGLKPLADNGGVTETHALRLSSPAVDAGNNLTGVPFDQRGSGFVRVSGANADIGAFEFDLSDVILANGFD